MSASVWDDVILPWIKERLGALASVNTNRVDARWTRAGEPARRDTRAAFDELAVRTAEIEPPESLVAEDRTLVKSVTLGGQLIDTVQSDLRRRDVVAIVRRPDRLESALERISELRSDWRVAVLTERGGFA